MNVVLPAILIDAVHPTFRPALRLNFTLPFSL